MEMDHVKLEEKTLALQQQVRLLVFPISRKNIPRFAESNSQIYVVTFPILR